MVEVTSTARAAAYVRRSASTRLSPGDASREAQLAAVRSIGGDDVDVFTDWGVSGRRADRPEYVRLKGEIAAGRVGSVCAYSLSRLGRSTRELLDFVELCKSRDVTIRTSVETIDTSTAMGRMTFTVMAAFAQLEAELAGERQSAARATRVARGDDLGAPWGYRLERQIDDRTGRQRLVRVRDEAVDTEPVLAAFREAGSVLGACRILQERGIRAPHGGVTWSTSVVANVVDREMPGARPRYDQRVRGRKAVATSPLTRLVKCPFCGRFMTPVVSTGQVYCAYGPKERAAHPTYHARSAPILAFAHAEAARYVEPRDEEPAEPGRDLEADRIALLARRERDVQMREDGLISRDEARRRVAAVERELELLAPPRPRSVYTDPSTWPASELNSVLRSLFQWIELDEALRPVRAEWVDPSWRSDEEPPVPPAGPRRTI